MSKVPDFGNVMGQFAPRLQELDHEISVLDVQRKDVLQRRLNTVLEEFQALLPEVEFGKTVVSHLHDRGGYRGKLIVRTGVVHPLRLVQGYSGTHWVLPVTHITKLTAWDRDNYEEYKENPSYNRRTTHKDSLSYIQVGDEFEIVGEIVKKAKYGLYEVKFL